MLCPRGVVAREDVDQVNTCQLDSMECQSLLGWLLQPSAYCGPEGGHALLADEIVTSRPFSDYLVREHVSGGMPLNRYFQHPERVSEVLCPRPDAVRRMTVHGSKGLGMEHAWLIGKAQEVFPLFQALREGSQGKELVDERRICPARARTGSR